MSFNPFIGTSNSSGSGGTGQDGRGIQEIFWILSSTGTKPGEAGAKDTYQILYTDGSTSTFIVQNGNNGRDGAKGESGTNGKDGQNGKDGITPIFRVSSNYIQVSIDNGLNYTNLVSLDSLRGADGESLEFNWLGTKLGIKKAGESEYTYVELKGETGDKGETGLQGENGEQGPPGVDGKNIELGTSETYIQWRTAGTEEWNNLIPISTLVGSAGRGINSIEFTSSTGGDIAGLAGAIDTYTITYSDNTSSTFTVYNGKNGDSHTHENKDVLDKLSDINGSLGYNNENVFKVWYGTKEEYEALADKKDDWTYIITNDNFEDTIVQFTKAETREPIQSGDSLGVILGKIAKYLEDLKTVAFTGNYSDLVDRPVEVTDAELNDILV